MAGSCTVIDEFAKEYLHSGLREIRETMLWKLDGVPEYDIRRPLTLTGTNLLGLVEHLSIWESRYFGEATGMPDTPTSCANNSTARPEPQPATRTLSAMRRSGRPNA